MHFNLTTFLFEIVNFLVLLVVLQRLIYRPLRKGIDARRQAQEDEAAALVTKEQAVLAQGHELDARARQLDELRLTAVREAAEAASEERARIL
jgi:F-type H+-transporting ATPase subunit b